MARDACLSSPPMCERDCIGTRTAFGRGYSGHQEWCQWFPHQEPQLSEISQVPVFTVEVTKFPGLKGSNGDEDVIVMVLWWSMMVLWERTTISIHIYHTQDLQLADCWLTVGCAQDWRWDPVRQSTGGCRWISLPSARAAWGMGWKAGKIWGEDARIAGQGPHRAWTLAQGDLFSCLLGNRRNQRWTVKWITRQMKNVMPVSDGAFETAIVFTTGQSFSTSTRAWPVAINTWTCCLGYIPFPTTSHCIYHDCGEPVGFPSTNHDSRHVSRSRSNTEEI